MKKEKKIVVVVPDGTGIKNYLYSRVFKNTEASLSLFHNFDDDTLSHINKNISIASYVQIPHYSESAKEKFLRELIHLSRLKHNAKKEKNPTILKFWKTGHASTKLKAFYTAVTLASKSVKSYKMILKLEKRYDEALRKNPFYRKVSEILKQQQPDIVFCTHQRALKMPTIFAAAKDLGIKTATVIYSWDNIPKARLALKADEYFVWSSYMKKELQLFYPEIFSEAIKITGTPQFEFYHDPSHIIEKDIFYKTYKLNTNKKLICFSGDDVKTSPYDPQYLHDIATAIANANKQDEYQILFRRCPVDVSGRYDWVVQEFPDLIVEMPPLWNFNSTLWSAVYPTIEDVALLVSLAFYADVVINVGSTMAFDFGMFNKPCIFINYDAKKDENWSVETIYNYQHFRSMPSKNAVLWLNSASEIAEVLETALQNPDVAISDWFNVIVNNAETASENIIKELT